MARKFINVSGFLSVRAGGKRRAVGARSRPNNLPDLRHGRSSAVCCLVSLSFGHARGARHSQTWPKTIQHARFGKGRLPHPGANINAGVTRGRTIGTAAASGTGGGAVYRCRRNRRAGGRTKAKQDSHGRRLAADGGVEKRKISGPADNDAGAVGAAESLGSRMRKHQHRLLFAGVADQHHQVFSSTFVRESPAGCFRLQGVSTEESTVRLERTELPNWMMPGAISVGIR